MQIDESKIKSLPFLLNKIGEKHPELNIPNCALLIGGGCSYSSGIPLTWGMVEIFRMRSFLMEEVIGGGTLLTDKSPGLDSRIMEKVTECKEAYDAYVLKKETQLRQRMEKDKDRYLAILKDVVDNPTWEEYGDACYNDTLYGFWFETYSEEPLRRYQLIEETLKGKEPLGAYILMAYLMKSGLINNVYTTNFDDLLHDAIVYYTYEKVRMYADDETSRFISVFADEANIIKLNGDYRYAIEANSLENMYEMAHRIHQKFTELLLDIDLVVLGYGGADHSIMSNLVKLKAERPFGLYWCGMNPAGVHWRVAQLINNTPNSYYIKIDGFDDFTARLFTQYGALPSPDLTSMVEMAQRKVDERLNTFATTVLKSNVAIDLQKLLIKEKVEERIGA